MRKKIKLLIIGCTITIFGTNIFLSQSTNATDYSPKIMPASPEAFKFGSYGNVPVGLFTGAPNINVPLATFTVDDINIPVSLSYSSNGIKLDEMNGSVGLGWNLISAGVITRTVRDLPDENSDEIKITPDIGILGLWSPDVVNYIDNAQKEGFDSEPDLYMANFAGNNIKFVFDRNDKPILYEKSNYQIIGNSGANSFKIISDKGVEYEFSAQETSLFRTQGGGHSITNNYVSSWYLTKIKSKGKEVHIEYYNSGYNTVLSQSLTMTYTPPGAIQYKLQLIGNECKDVMYTVPASINNNNIVSMKQILSGKQIKRIYYNDESGNAIQEMLFTYGISQNDDFNALQTLIYKSKNHEIHNYDFEYTTTANGRMFLKGIKNTKDKGRYEFDYLNKDQLPQRLSSNNELSKSRDIWGLYNGKTNNTLIPQIFDSNDPNRVVYNGADQNFISDKASSGLLNKITYPTAGTTDIIYEPHLRSERKVISGEKKGITLSVSRDSDTGVSNDAITIIPKKDELISIGVSAKFNNKVCESSDNTGKTKVKLEIQDKDGKGYIIYNYSTSLNSYLPEPNFSFQAVENETVIRYIFLKKGEPVQFKLSASFFCTQGTAVFSYTVGDDIIQNYDTPFGGLRVESTIDNFNSSIPVKKKFLYSSVNVLREPYFLEYHTDRSYCGTSRFYNDIYYYSLTSNNLAQLNATMPNIFYGTVTEEVEGKGKIIHTFDTNSDYFGKILIGKDIASSPWTNFGWSNGKEKNTLYKDVSGNTLREVQYDYIEDTSRKNYVDAISIRKNFDLKKYGDVTLTCTEDNINSTYQQYFCKANHTHLWLTSDGSGKCHASGNENVLAIFNGYCYKQPIGTVIIMPNIFENLDVVNYKNISHFDYLQAQSTTNYLNGTPLLTTTEYFYNNPSHYQLTDEKTTFPNKTFQETTYEYAQEKNKTKLIEANMVGIPLETTVVKKQNSNDPGKTISKIYTDYPDTLPDSQTGNLLLPKSVSTLNLSTGSMEVGVTYNQYDSKGNLLQYTTKSGIPTAIVWGYDNTQPIAKIEGAKYSEVSGYIAEIVSKSDADNSAGTPASEQDLINELNIFRKKPELSVFQITTYTYDPLIGVRSITPPSGIREVYNYDNANRLEKVVDVNGNILKEYQYNYKH